MFFFWNTVYNVYLGLIGERVMDFLLALIELFSLGVTAEELRAIIGWKSAISFQRGPVDPKFQVEGVVPHRTLQTRLVLWQKVTFHNSLNVEMFINTYRKCWFADVSLCGVTVCSTFYTKCVITLHNGCMWLKESKNTENSHGKCYKQSND